MVHWAWLIVAFVAGGVTALAWLFAYLTQGFSTTSLKLWKAAFEHILAHQGEVTARAGVFAEESHPCA